MTRSARALMGSWLLLVGFLPVACSSLNEPTVVSHTRLALPAEPAKTGDSGPLAEVLRQVVCRAPVAAPSSPTEPRTETAALAEFSVDAVVAQVLARNPSLAQMTAAWQAAAARYPQVIALDDPMVGSMMAPASIGSNAVEFGYRLEVAQKIPFPGKRGLRGQSAQSEAAAAGSDVDDMRLQLIESAKSAFYDDYLVARALAVNEENQRLLKRFREEAKTRYEKGLVPEQDVVQADVELGRQQERGLTLERMRKIAVARINTLMHAPPDAPLPPPPERLRPADGLPSIADLRALSLTRRPDLRALSARIDADTAALALAHKEFCPDFEVTAAFDTIMGNGPTRDLAAQVGVRLNLPVQRQRRYAAVAEAEARLAERRAQLDGRIDQVNLQVQEAYEQVAESEKILRLYEDKLLPDARKNVEAARSAYETRTAPFLSLIEAQRSRTAILDRSYEALADYFRRRATLERVVGGALPRTE